MNLPLFIARRIGIKSTTNSSRVMVRIAIVSISLSAAVMIIAMGVVGGFKKELTEKIRTFAADLQLTQRSDNNRMELTPFVLDTAEIERLRAIKGVEKIEGYATVNGLMQTENGVLGVIIKGVAANHAWHDITDGAPPVYVDSVRSRDIVLSGEISRKMGLIVGDVFRFIVVNENPRNTRFRVAAIYDSGLSDFDSKFIYGDAATIARINGWDDGMVEGYQITTDRSDSAAEALFDELPDGRWNLDSTRDSFVQFFDWIEMMELNTTFVLIIMLIVAAISMLSGVLVIVLESVQMVGVLKTQGITNGQLQRIFVYRSGYIVLRGLLWGNFIGLGVCAVQYFFGWLALDADAYLLSRVPIWVSVTDILIINFGAFLTITLLMIIPTTIVAKIEPAVTIKFK